jgi:small subunit ribosomal protein S5
MTPENTTEKKLETTVAETGESTQATKSPAKNADNNGEKKFSYDRKGGKGDRRDDRRGDRKEKPKKEFDELLLEVRRVTRVTTGGRRMSFRATILIGNRKGKIGL